MSCDKVKAKCHSTFLEYRVAQTRRKDSKLLGCGIWVIKILIFLAFCGYLFLMKRYYEVSDRIISSTSTKVKGVSYTTVPSPVNGKRILDGPDYTIPPQENGAFFIMTNALITRRQTPGNCGADPNRPMSQCSKDADCVKGLTIHDGIATGRCVKSVIDTRKKVCEITAWCPVESSAAKPEKPLLEDAYNFTILIKSQVLFPHFKARTSNTRSSSRISLDSCLYNAKHRDFQHCPVFRLGDILKDANQSFSQIGATGGFIVVTIDWNCYVTSMKNCEPSYSFERLDDDDGDAKSVGWNFRYANYFSEGGKDYRDLTKAFGIRFVVEVTGRAYAINYYSIFRICLAIGSVAGLFKVADFLYGRVASFYPNVEEDKKDKDEMEMQPMKPTTA